MSMERLNAEEVLRESAETEIEQASNELLNNVALLEAEIAPFVEGEGLQHELAEKSEAVESSMTTIEQIAHSCESILIAASEPGAALAMRIGKLLTQPQVTYLQAQGVAPIFLSFVALLPLIAKGVSSVTEAIKNGIPKSA